MNHARDLRDALHAAHDDAMKLRDGTGIVGYGVATLLDGDGKVVSLNPFHNLITDAGDLYIAGKTIQGISPANASAPTAATGMKLGSGTTATAKAGAGGALVTYISASQQLFATGYPQTANLGAGLGVNAVYRSAWAAGTATAASITEVVVVNDAASNATSTAANTYSRALFGSAINKAAGDSLTVDWNWKTLGS